MRSLIVFESMYGITRVIAEAGGAVSNGCAWDTQLCNVGNAPVEIPADVDLCVVFDTRFGKAESIAMAMGATSATAP